MYFGTTRYLFGRKVDRHLLDRLMFAEDFVLFDVELGIGFDRDVLLETLLEAIDVFRFVLLQHVHHFRVCEHNNLLVRRQSFFFDLSEDFEADGTSALVVAAAIAVRASFR